MDCQHNDAMWSQVATELRRLAGIATMEWMRAELLRSAAFYEKLGNGFGGGLTTRHNQSTTKNPPAIASQ
jgi:hypothetical protein